MAMALSNVFVSTVRNNQTTGIFPAEQMGYRLITREISQIDHA